VGILLKIYTYTSKDRYIYYILKIDLKIDDVTFKYIYFNLKKNIFSSQ